jgi:adenylate cyclase
LRYRFGIYALDAQRRELRRGEAAVPVTPQVFDILEYLIRHRERVVSKDDLIAAIWDGRVITDGALTTRLNAARHAIGDSGSQQRSIKTLTRKGYRFVAAVREDGGPSMEATHDTAPRRPKLATPSPGNPTITVPPFANLSGRPDLAFLADAISDDVPAALTKLRWLGVLARAPGVADGNGIIDRLRSFQELGARYVLQGRLRSGGGGVRVTAMLIDTNTGMLTWSDRYDRDAGDLSRACDDITVAMAAAVGTAIIEAERQRAARIAPDQLDAWEAYQRGMWHMSKCEPDENALAQTFFRRAIDLDPHQAAGHGALGWSHMMAASIYSQMSIDEGCALAEPLVRKATALDEHDVDARARLAIAAMLRGDLEGAFEGAEKVLSVNENCAEALGVMGTALLYSGRRHEGRAAIQRHLQLSPRDPARPIRLAQIAASHYLDGDYPAASAMARHVVRHYPRHPTAYRWLAASLGQLGRLAEADEALRYLQSLSPSSFDMYIRQRPRYCGIEHAPLLDGLRKAGWQE